MLLMKMDSFGSRASCGLLDSPELLQRLLIVAHCGPQGHRGSDVMIAALAERFSIINLKPLVARFLRDCLLCKHVKGGKIVMRPWGPTSTATKRNECVLVSR